MAYDVTTTPPVGDATKRSDYTRLRDAIQALGGLRHSLGGSLGKFISDTSYVDLEEGEEWEIDGTNLSGLSVYFEVNAMCQVTAAVTITMDLYNITTGASVASSEVTIAATTAYERKHTKSSTITLASGVNRYKARIKGSTGAGNKVAGVASVSIRG